MRLPSYAIFMPMAGNTVQISVMKILLRDIHPIVNMLVHGNIDPVYISGIVKDIHSIGNAGTEQY